MYREIQKSIAPVTTKYMHHGEITYSYKLQCSGKVRTVG
jgi:hypothetical protein